MANVTHNSTASTNTEANKQIVREFYDLAFNKRKPDEAAAKHVGPKYIKHSPLVGDGAETFVQGIAGWISTMPDLKVDIKRLLAEGDLVAVHNHFIPQAGARGMAVMDIFRLENGKIVEHWDVLQEVPEKSANTNTMF